MQLTFLQLRCEIMQFLLDEKYDVTYQEQVKGPGRAKPSTFQITLKNLMYHR